MRILLIALVMQFCLGYTAYADTDSTNCGNSDLRIFTPYHNVKNVFSFNYVLDEDIDSVSASKPGIQRQLTWDDIDLIASVVHAESQGEPFEGKVGVASVILNRLYHPSFPKSIKEVIYQKNAFSCIKNGDISCKPDTEAYKAVDEALQGNDPTGQAVFFYNPKIASSSWMKSISKNETVTIGRHVFFK